MALNFDVTRSFNYGQASKAYGKGKETVSKQSDANTVLNRPETGKADKTGKKDYGEGTLSVKAQELLKKLRDKYTDYDIFVGDSEEALNDLSKGSNKDVSVMFSADEIEKMAEDEEYMNTRLSDMEKAVGEAVKFMEDYNNSDESKESGQMIKSVAITVNSDGTTSVFAELAKVNDAQRERIEKAQAEKADKAKEEAKKAEKEKSAGKPEKSEKADKEEPVKVTKVTADSLEELKKIIGEFDWSIFEKADESVKGQHIDFTV